MKKKQQGFILIVVLVFLQLFIFINLYCITLVTRVIKQSFLKTQQRRYLLRMPAIANRIAKHLPNKPCQIPITAADVLVERRKAWWTQMACKGQFQKVPYFYVVEFLGADPCGLTTVATVAAYYRITLFIEPATIRHSELHWQETIALASLPTERCQGVLHWIRPGPQMQRELI